MKERIAGAPMAPLRCLTSTTIRGDSSPRASGDAMTSRPPSGPFGVIRAQYPMALSSPATRRSMSSQSSWFTRSLISSMPLSYVAARASSLSSEASSPAASSGIGCEVPVVDRRSFMTSPDTAKIVWMPPREFLEDCLSASRDADVSQRTVRV